MSDFAHVKHLFESSTSKSLTLAKASLVRNWISKTFPKFKAFKSTGGNPYSEFEAHYGQFSDKTSADNLVKELEQAGWKKPTGWLNVSDAKARSFENPAGVVVVVMSNHLVRISGKKAAKRSNLPTYD